jgi:hypothetical protein
MFCKPPMATSEMIAVSLPLAPIPMSIMVELSAVVDALAAFVDKNSIDIVSVDAVADAASSCVHAPTPLAVPPDVVDTMLVFDATHERAEPVKNGARAMPPSRGDQTAPPLIAGYRVEI